MTQETFGLEKRKPGGQPCNQNARTHGFYSKNLAPVQQEVLQFAGLSGLDREIAVLRLKITSIIANDPSNIRVMILALTSLARLLEMKQVLGPDGTHLLAEVRNALQTFIAVRAILPESSRSTSPRRNRFIAVPGK